MPTDPRRLAALLQAMTRSQIPPTDPGNINPDIPPHLIGPLGQNPVQLPAQQPVQQPPVATPPVVPNRGGIGKSPQPPGLGGLIGGGVRPLPGSIGGGGGLDPRAVIPRAPLPQAPPPAIQPLPTNPVQQRPPPFSTINPATGAGTPVSFGAGGNGGLGQVLQGLVRQAGGQRAGRQTVRRV